MLFPLYVVLIYFFSAPPAWAADAPPLPHTQLLPDTQFWAAVIGALSPLVAYVLNYLGPHVKEPVKTAVVGAVAVIAGALTQLLEAGELNWDIRTAQVVLTALFTAFVSHQVAWKPSGIARKLGAGRNKNAPDGVVDGPLT